MKQLSDVDIYVQDCLRDDRNAPKGFKFVDYCPYDGQPIEPEMGNKCNNGNGCDSCPHNQE